MPKVYLCQFGRNKANGSRNVSFKGKFHIFTSSCALEIRSKSPKSNQLLMIYQYKIEENLSTGRKIVYLQDCDLENEVKVTKILSAL